MYASKTLLHSETPFMARRNRSSFSGWFACHSYISAPHLHVLRSASGEAHGVLEDLRLTKARGAIEIVVLRPRKCIRQIGARHSSLKQPANFSVASRHRTTDDSLELHPGSEVRIGDQML